jgi:tetratricopeptide (TPR) repeat protein
MARGSAGSAGPTLATIQGMAGVGKTALAVKVAHLAAEHYPDGSIYLDLRGFGTGTPLSPAEALGQLLRATGLPADAVPSSVERASALLRSRLAGKRVLLLLDNAFGADQVLPLLPGGSSSCVLVTSRQNLTTLPADRRVQLEPLSQLDAVDIFKDAIGEERTAADPAAIAELIELCGRLPLALGIAAARLAARPTWSTNDLLDRLRDETSRLNELTDDHIGVRAALAVSISQLPDQSSAAAPSLVDTFALLGILTGPDIGTQVAAHLLDTTERAAEDALEHLVDVHLLESPSPGRYRLHDLVHVYARETAEQRLPVAARRAAVERVIALFRAIAWRGVEVYDPLSVRLDWCPSTWLEPAPPLVSAQESFIWLDVERDNLRALFDHLGTDLAVAGDMAAGLVLGLSNYLAVHGRREDWSQNISAILALTQEPRLRAALFHDRGVTLADGGTTAHAADDLRRSVAAFHAIDDARGEALASNNYSRVLDRLGRHQEAILVCQNSLRLYQQIGDRRGEARALHNLSNLFCSIGSYSEELTSITESLVAFEAIGSELGIAVGQHNLGCALLHYDMVELATDYMHRSLQGYEKLGHRAGLTDAYRDLGAALVDTGSTAEGFKYLQRALAIADEREDDRRQASVRLSLGKAYLAVGNEERARTDLLAALDYYDGRAPKVAEEIVQLLGDLEN